MLAPTCPTCSLKLARVLGSTITKGAESTSPAAEPTVAAAPVATPRDAVAQPDPGIRHRLALGQALADERTTSGLSANLP